VDSRIQVQLEEDGGGRTRQSWMETSGLWPMFHRERQGISQLSHKLCWLDAFNRLGQYANSPGNKFTVKQNLPFLPQQ